MSAFTDAFKLLDGESNVFVFLPVVNQGYVYWKTTSPSLTQTGIVLVSLLVSVTVFNIITHGNFDRYGPDNETMDMKYSILFIGIAIVWLLIFLYSLTQLYGLFSSGKIWPILLSAISLLFVCLLVTHGILSWILPMYDSDYEG